MQGAPRSWFEMTLAFSSTLGTLLIASAHRERYLGAFPHRSGDSGIVVHGQAAH